MVRSLLAPIPESGSQTQPNKKVSLRARKMTLGNISVNTSSFRRGSELIINNHSLDFQKTLYSHDLSRGKYDIVEALSAASKNFINIKVYRIKI